MDGDIILDRGHTTVMKLDADEQALMDEIEISVPQPRPVQRPQKSAFGLVAHISKDQAFSFSMVGVDWLAHGLGRSLGFLVFSFRLELCCQFLHM